MTSERSIYRYEIGPDLPMPELEETIVLALLGAEALHGEAVVRLDAKHFLDEEGRVLLVDATAPAGRDFNRLLAGFLSREFGPDSFQVERALRPASASAPAPTTTPTGATAPMPSAMKAAA